MTRYRFLDSLGDVILEDEHADHSAALEWARTEEETADGVNRVEYLDDRDVWRWAGPLQA